MPIYIDGLKQDGVSIELPLSVASGGTGAPGAKWATVGGKKAQFTITYEAL